MSQKNSVSVGPNEKNRRLEIDVLRSIAVLSVVLFHAEFVDLNNGFLFRGGYLGVDIFFVISGYLMAEILNRMPAGIRSCREFLLRRLFRIYPLLIVVLLVGIAAASIFLSVSHFSQVSWQAITALLAISNWYFFFDSDYWDLYQAVRPFLHTWSLGVELQFYLFLPLFYFVLVKQRWFFQLCASLSFVLLCYGQYVGEAAFFQTPARFGELLFGVCIYLFQLRYSHFKTYLPAGFIFWVGIALIGFAIALEGEDVKDFTRFLPILLVGVAFSIIGGNAYFEQFKVTLLRAGFGYLARISYSLYMVHFVVIFFSHYASMDFSSSNSQKLIAIAASVVISVVSYRVVEQPFLIHSLTRKRLATLMLLLLAVLVPVLFTVSQNWEVNKKTSSIFMSDAENAAYVVRNVEAHSNLQFAKNDKSNLLILGDSFGEDLLNALLESRSVRDKWNIEIFRASPACNLLYVDVDLQNYVREVDWPYCKDKILKDNKSFLARSEDAQLIIWTGNWRDWNINLIDQASNALKRDFDAEILVLSGKSFGMVRQRQMSQMSVRLRSSVRVKPNPDAVRREKLLSDKVDPSEYIDVIRLFCGMGHSCPQTNALGEPITFDGWHLTPAGSEAFISLLLENTVFRSKLQLPAVPE